jgi:peptidoglycan/xylan/chitin deacetylase (PgdA/CDA1 family)
MKNIVLLLIISSVIFGYINCYPVDNNDIFLGAGKNNKKVVALTFDDGPGPNTEKVIEILNKYNIKATFFVEGSLVKLYPEIAKKIVDAGNEIGNHTYSHINYYTYKNQDKEKILTEEIEKSEKIILQVTGIKTTLLRMPYGYTRDWVLKIAQKKGYKIVSWTFGYDWHLELSSDKLLDLYTKNIHNGAIFLLHDGGTNRKKTLAILPNLIEKIKEKGYNIVTISEMFELK